MHGWMQASASSSSGPAYITPSSKGFVYEANCLDWLARCQPMSIHAVLTDPPYGMLEYSPEQMAKLRKGGGGVWRIPPSIGGSLRAPLPRFTVLNKEDIREIYEFLSRLGALLLPAIIPGGHIAIASSPLFNHVVTQALIDTGFEKRGEIVRLVRTLQGGDRPKGAGERFPSSSVIPRSSWEPWILLRRPFSGTAASNLEAWRAGALRRPAVHEPFCDVIPSGRTPRSEKAIASHPSLKPQAFLRQMAHALLPFDHGVILDPFAGSGSTVAACEALGLQSIGVEIDPVYVEMAKEAIPRLAAISCAASSLLAVHTVGS